MFKVYLLFFVFVILVVVWIVSDVWILYVEYYYMMSFFIRVFNYFNF